MPVHGSDSRRILLITIGTSFGLALTWLLLLRASFILTSGVWPTWPAALFADVAGAAILAVLLNLAVHWLPRTLLVLALGLFSFSAGMHLGAHGTLPKIALVSKSADPVFLSSSLFNAHLLLLPFYLGFAWLLTRLHRARAVKPLAHWRWQVLAIPLIMVGYGLSLPSLTTPANNIVASFLTQIPTSAIAPAASNLGESLAIAEPPDGDRFFEQKARGEDVSNPPNVLLIMIEGLSAGYFPEVSSYHRLEPVVRLDALEQTLNRMGFRLYRNVISMERQTDRGSFALLCGQYPDFQRLSTKMRDVAEERAFPTCMPELLKRRGYHTAYWQAAPLAYMHKDGFMPRIGFADATGAEAFGAEDEIQGWGPTDPEYFPEIANRIRALHQAHRPWMVTLLNVGTHHPFDTGDRQAGADNPEEAALRAATEPQQARRNAMKVMGDTLTDLLKTLESEGILDHTLVVLTSDESGGFVRQDQASTPLNNNMGMLAIRPPGNDALERYADRDRLVVQLDIPLTIVDVAGAAPEATTMTGRSLLVTRGLEGRELLLADIYTGMKYFLRESGQLLACTESLLRCNTWSFEPRRLFGTLTPSAIEPFVTLDERIALFGMAATIEETGQQQDTSADGPPAVEGE